MGLDCVVHLYDSHVESTITLMIGSWKDILLCSSPSNLDSARWLQFSGQTQGLLIGKGCIAKMCSMLGRSRNEGLRQLRQSFPSDSFPFCNPIHPDIWNIISPPIHPDIWNTISPTPRHIGLPKVIKNVFTWFLFMCSSTVSSGSRQDCRPSLIINEDIFLCS